MRTWIEKEHLWKRENAKRKEKYRKCVYLFATVILQHAACQTFCLLFKFNYKCRSRLIANKRYGENNILKTSFKRSFLSYYLLFISLTHFSSFDASTIYNIVSTSIPLPAFCICSAFIYELFFHFTWYLINFESICAALVLYMYFCFFKFVWVHLQCVTRFPSKNLIGNIIRNWNLKLWVELLYLFFFAT